MLCRIDKLLGGRSGDFPAEQRHDDEDKRPLEQQAQHAVEPDQGPEAKATDSSKTQERRRRTPLEVDARWVNADATGGVCHEPQSHVLATSETDVPTEKSRDSRKRPSPERSARAVMREVSVTMDEMTRTAPPRAQLRGTPSTPGEARHHKGRIYSPRRRMRSWSPMGGAGAPAEHPFPPRETVELGLADRTGGEPCMWQGSRRSEAAALEDSTRPEAKEKPSANVFERHAFDASVEEGREQQGSFLEEVHGAGAAGPGEGRGRMAQGGSKQERIGKIGGIHGTAGVGTSRRSRTSSAPSGGATYVPCHVGTYRDRISNATAPGGCARR